MSKQYLQISVVLLVVALAGVSVAMATGLSGQGNMQHHGHHIRTTGSHGESNVASQQHMHGGSANFVNNSEITKDNCLADECVISASSTTSDTLPSDVESALDDAIADEYKALETYRAVMNQFGDVRPFTMIARSEQMHIATLKSIYDKYGLDVPENSYANQVETPSSIAQACSDAVEAEITNGKLYENELIPTVSGEYPDIARAFLKLQSASQNRHLPAFKRCQNR